MYQINQFYLSDIQLFLFIIFDFLKLNYIINSIILETYSI